METQLTQQFGNRIRVRCLALIKNDGKILLIKHRGLNPQNCYWMPPGGGVDATESAAECLTREVREEVNLTVVSNSYYCLHEYNGNQLHAIELFFEAEVQDFNAQLGFDPEVAAGNQFMIEIKWMDKAAICNLADGLIHPVIKKYVTCEKQV